MVLATGAREFRLGSETGAGCRLHLSTRASRQPSPFATGARVSRASISSRDRDNSGDRGSCTGVVSRNASRSALSDITNVVPSSQAQAALKPVPPAPVRGEGRKPPSLPPPTAAGDGPPSTRSSCAPGDGSPFQADAEGVQSVAEYVPDVIDLLFREESYYVPRSGFMDKQTDINSKMRAILVDWLVEVHQKYNLRPLTLFLTVNIIDRYLALKSIPRKRLQLVGVSALFIAAKYEEIQPPRLAEYVYITDNAYTKQDLINMECTMLAALGFRVVAPTIAQFLEVFQRANRCDKVHEKVSCYLVELAILDPHLSSCSPSLLASASVLLSNELLGRSTRWPLALQRHARRTEADLLPMVAELRSALAAAPTNSLQAIHKKYTLPANYAVARKVAAPTLK